MSDNSLTCFASKQIILDGAKCYISLARQESGYKPVSTEYQGIRHTVESISTDTVNPNCFWDPLTGFMEAEFTRDEILTVCRTPRNFEQLMYLVEYVLLARAAVVQEGENPHHETPYDIKQFMEANSPKLLGYCNAKPRPVIDELEFNELFDELDAVFKYTLWATIRNRLFIGKRDRLRPAQFAVIHSEAYEQLLQMATGDTVEKALRETFSKLLPRIQGMSGGKFVSQCRAILHKLGFEEKDHLVETALWAFLDEAQQNVFTFAHGLREMDTTVFKAVIERYLVRDVSDDELFEAASPMLKDRLILREMDYLNIQIAPLVFIGYVGDNTVGLRYAAFALRVGKAVKKQLEDLEEKDDN